MHREFFANRAAALAVKAKVEAYERSGADFSGGITSQQTQQQAVVVQVRGPPSGQGMTLISCLNVCT